MKKLQDTFFDKLKSSIDDLIDDEQLSIGRVGHPFTVHPGYFVELRTSILSSVKSLNGRPSVFTINRKSVWYSAAAVAVFAMVGAGMFFNQDDSVSINQLSSEEIVAYLETQPLSMAEISTNADFTADELSDIELATFPLTAEDIDIGSSNAIMLYEIEEL